MRPHIGAVTASAGVDTSHIKQKPTYHTYTAVEQDFNSRHTQRATQ